MARAISRPAAAPGRKAAGSIAARELSQCHDCGEAVSFTAFACPHCGSSEPRGPYRYSRRERRRLDIERRNDFRLIKITVACCLLGIIYGVIVSPGSFWTVLEGLGYGLVGLVVGPPAAFVVNFVKRWIG